MIKKRGKLACINNADWDTASFLKSTVMTVSNSFVEVARKGVDTHDFFIFFETRIFTLEME